MISPIHTLIRQESDKLLNYMKANNVDCTGDMLWFAEICAIEAINQACILLESKFSVAYKNAAEEIREHFGVDPS